MKVLQKAEKRLEREVLKSNIGERAEKELVNLRDLLG